MARVIHEFSPVYNQSSKILILGTFPSVKSRESQFFYGHPQNRFWKVLAALLGKDIPSTVEEKRRFLLTSQIAVWDVIASCEIEGSSDSSIKNVIPNDIHMLIQSSNIKQIYCNGGKAHSLYQKYCQPLTGCEAIKLPSTSPANAGYSLERLLEEWKGILEKLKE